MTTHPMITPVGNRVVVQLSKQATTSSSGIIVSAKEKDEQAIGEIVAIGKGYGDDENVSELGLSVGDRVLISKYGGEELKDMNHDDIVYKIVPGKDIVAILSKTYNS